MKLLYPEKNYTISANILEYRPPTRMDDVRLVRMTDEASELDRKSKFSFAVMDMLQITPATKLMFLQVSVIPVNLILSMFQLFLQRQIRKAFLFQHFLSHFFKKSLIIFYLLTSDDFILIKISRNM